MSPLPPIILSAPVDVDQHFQPAMSSKNFPRYPRVARSMAALMEFSMAAATISVVDFRTILIESHARGLSGDEIGI
jgi:hypothetical protein